MPLLKKFSITVTIVSVQALFRIILSIVEQERRFFKSIMGAGGNRRNRHRDTHGDREERIIVITDDRSSAPCLILCCCCIAGIFILVWIFFLIKITVSVSKADINITRGNELEHSRSGKMIDYYENVRACSADSRNLPHPRTQKEEDEIIMAMNYTVNPDCEFVFFGFKADENVRYQTLSGDVTWPTMKTLLGGVLPFNFKDCYEIGFLGDGSLSVESVLNCAGIIDKDLLFLTKNNEECSDDSFTCIEIYKSLPHDDVETSFISARSENPNLLTLLPFDKNLPPESLQLQQTKFAGPVIVMAVKYKFVYKHGNTTQPYTSNRFLVVNPEYDCVAYDIKRDKIVTRNCEDKGCPICLQHEM